MARPENCEELSINTHYHLWAVRHHWNQETNLGKVKMCVVPRNIWGGGVTQPILQPFAISGLLLSIQLRTVQRLDVGRWLYGEI